MGKIVGEIESSWDETDTVTIPREKYEKLLGNKLVYPIGQKLACKILNNTDVKNILITGYSSDVNGHPIYKIKSYGGYCGSHIEEAGKESLTTEYGLSDYKPVVDFLKIVPVSTST